MLPCCWIRFAVSFCLLWDRSLPCSASFPGIGAPAGAAAAAAAAAAKETVKEMLPFVSHPSSSSWGCWRRSAFPFILCLSIITVSSATATLNRGLSVDGANAGTVGTPGAASPEPSGRYEEEKETEICTQNLRDAVNAAISHVIGKQFDSLGV